MYVGICYENKTEKHAYPDDWEHFSCTVEKFLNYLITSKNKLDQNGKYSYKKL